MKVVVGLYIYYSCSFFDIKIDDGLLYRELIVRTAEGGVSTGGGMDMTKYLSGSYHILYTLHDDKSANCLGDFRFRVFVFSTHR